MSLFRRLGIRPAPLPDGRTHAEGAAMQLATADSGLFYDAARA